MGTLCTKNIHIESVSADTVNHRTDVASTRNNYQQHKIKNILLVDDIKATETLFKGFIEFYINNPKINFHYVSSGEEAIKYIQQGHDVDIILMDIIMGQPPQLNGYQTTQKIREIGFNNLILGLTGMVDDASKIKGVRAGINDFCDKPIKFDDLVELVKSKGYVWQWD